MRSWYLSACVAVCSLTLGATEVFAQPQPGISNYRSPTVSPYLNLLRGPNGNAGTPAINYFALVRPEIQTSQSLLGLGSDVNTNRQAINDLTFGLPATGHPTQFLNLGSYFLSNGTGPGGPQSAFSGVMGTSGAVSGGIGTPAGGGTSRPAYGAGR